MSKSSRPKIGDIVEIGTPSGYAYAQYSHHHYQPPTFGALLRVLPGLYQQRPQLLGELVQGPERFFVFFPLGAAVRRGIVSIVGHADIPERIKSFPLFRDGIVDPATGRVEKWWLWDGQREWQVGELTPDQQQLPMRQIVNDTFLIEKILGDQLPRSSC
jgi:hypothetical protein